MMLTDGILLLLLFFLGNCGRKEEDDRYEKVGGLTGIIQYASSMSMRMPLCFGCFIDVYSRRVKGIKN